MNTTHPFDAAATAYDPVFTYSRLGLWLREMIRAYIPFQAGEHVLELGCGTGEDAVWLAERGVRVMATDAAAGMLNAAREKIDAAGVDDYATLAQFDLNRLDTARPATDRVYDGLLANFGVLNCAEDRRTLAGYLAAQLRPGALAILVVMGPLCPWEIGWHVLRSDWRTAFRRWRSGQMAHTGGGEMMRVWYPTPRRLRAEFSTDFHCQRTVGIGTLLPPSYLAHLVERWPRTFERLGQVDRRLGPYFPLTVLNDHYLLVLERR
jgi:2-polyprenyl-3-methyl-5-hydroxy-6-metoxy-1,4-benzoquinol methylase